MEAPDGEALGTPYARGAVADRQYFDDKPSFPGSWASKT